METLFTTTELSNGKGAGAGAYWPTSSPPSVRLYQPMTSAPVALPGPPAELPPSSGLGPTRSPMTPFARKAGFFGCHWPAVTVITGSGGAAQQPTSASSGSAIASPAVGHTSAADTTCTQSPHAGVAQSHSRTAGTQNFRTHQAAGGFWDQAARDLQQKEISCSRQPRRRRHSEPQDRSSGH
jgi:hypothetical protein